MEHRDRDTGRGRAIIKQAKTYGTQRQRQREKGEIIKQAKRYGTQRQRYRERTGDRDSQEETRKRQTIKI